ncbi:MAG: benzoate/H(+) symporter BenE family transporter [Pseudobdellovibrio sp.]
MKNRNMLKDFSLSTITAGLIADLVGYSSSAILVFQAALAAGTNSLQASSWLGILCVAMGLLTITLSLRYKAPILFAWSTAGAALLITSLPGVPLSDAVGAFLFSAFLIILTGITGSLEKIIKHIPVSLASAMLGGILLRFGLGVFTSMTSQFFLAFMMLLTFLVSRRFYPRYSVIFSLVIGSLIAWFQNLIHFETLSTGFAYPHLTTPTFSFSALLGIGLPLYIVTMTSQNMTGSAILKAFGFTDVPISKLITWSGIANFITAPFGGFALNLSAITAAICMGPEAHLDKDRRYTAAIASGLFYIAIGIFSSSVTSLFSSLPKELILTITGLALFGTISQSIATALQHDSEREAAFITFVATASGFTLFGIGSAFWGLIAGIFVIFVLKWKR